MVTARLPHEAETVFAMLSKHLVEPAVAPSQRRPDLGIPAAIDALILGAMAKDPWARPQTMEAFGEQIAALRQRLGAEPTGPQAPAMAAPAAHPDAPYTGPGSAPVVYAPPLMPTPTPLPGAMPGAPLAAAYTPPWPSGPAPGTGSAALPPVGPPAAGARRKAAIIAVAGVIATGAGIGALVLANRGPAVVAPTPEPVRVAGVSADAPPPADAPPAPATDPWQQPPLAPATEPGQQPPPVTTRPTPGTRPRSAPPASASGRKMSIGQGVQLVIPAGFQIMAKDDLVAAANPRGVLIAGGPIAIASNDPKELARYHARVNHLVFDKMTTLPVAGVQHPAAVFHATVAGVLVAHVAVALIGPTYRVAVAFQFPLTLAKDKATEQLIEDLFTRGIILP
jgi:hypothetical protein